MANWSLWSGSLFTIATVIAGWFAYNSVAHDEASHAAMTLHRNWAIPTAILFLIIAISAIHLARNKNVPGIRFILVSLIALILLMITGWLGAEAVYRYGLGVMSLPQVETGTEGHNHSHNDEPEVSTLHRHEMVEEQNHAQMQDKKIKMNSSDMTIEVQTEYDHPSQRSNSEISSHQH